MGPFTTYRKAALNEAWRDGYNVAKAGGARHDRPNYQGHDDLRRAFDCGWNEYLDHYGPVTVYC